MWADPDTLRGRVEQAIWPIISGGASTEHIDDVVNNILRLIESEVRSIE